MFSEELFAFCSGQCQASRFPPTSCRCICQGRNHGILRHSRTINVTPKTHDEQFNAWMNRFEEPAPVPRIEPLKQLPHIQPKPILSKADTDVYPVGRAVKRFVKKITGIRSQDDLNQSIVKGLRAQFNEANTNAAIDQAFSVFYSKQPDGNRPELYELYESGHIDTALEMFGKRWVIGRPKVRH